MLPPSPSRPASELGGARVWKVASQAMLPNIYSHYTPLRFIFVPLDPVFVMSGWPGVGLPASGKYLYRGILRLIQRRGTAHALIYSLYLYHCAYPYLFSRAQAAPGRRFGPGHDDHARRVLRHRRPLQNHRLASAGARANSSAARLGRARPARDPGARKHVPTKGAPGGPLGTGGAGPPSFPFPFSLFSLFPFKGRLTYRRARALWGARAERRF